MDKRSTVRIKPNVVKIYYYLHKFTIRCTSKNIAMIVWLHHTSIVWNWKHLIIIIKISDCHKIEGSVNKLSIWLFKITYWSQYVIFPVFCPFSFIRYSRNLLRVGIGVHPFNFPVSSEEYLQLMTSFFESMSNLLSPFLYFLYTMNIRFLFSQMYSYFVTFKNVFQTFFFLFYRPCTVMLHVLDTKSSSDLTSIESVPPPLGLMYLIHYVHYRWYIWKAIVIAWG